LISHDIRNPWKLLIELPPFHDVMLFLLLQTAMVLTFLHA
jgi:hypothetical protein